MGMGTDLSASEKRSGETEEIAVKLMADWNFWPPTAATYWAMEWNTGQLQPRPSRCSRPAYRWDPIARGCSFQLLQCSDT